MDDVARIAEGLSEAQRAWIKAAPTIPFSMTADEWDARLPLFVQFEPDEFCAER